MKKISHILFSTSALLAPIVVLAQETKTFGDLVQRALDLVNPILLLIAGLALIFFFWGLAKFILKAGDEKAKEEGKRFMIWGIAALFVMLSIWGIIELFQESIFGRIPDAGF